MKWSAEMRHIRNFRLGAGAFAIAASALVTGGVFAAQPSYALTGPPEFGRCVHVTVRHTGEYAGPSCTVRKKSNRGSYDWVPVSAEEHLKFALDMVTPQLRSTGAHAATIKCGGALGEGEYTGERSLAVTKALFTDCLNPAIEGEKSFCQATGSKLGELEATDLTGELQAISTTKKGVVDPGVDLAGKLKFECEGGNETLNKGLGTGTTREVEGSVIGRVSSALNAMQTAFEVKDEVSGSTQVPESFEHGSTDTLTTVVTPFLGTEKTSEPTLLTTTDQFKDEGEEQIEIRVACKRC
jgi:hypothetical protein